MTKNKKHGFLKKIGFMTAAFLKNQKFSIWSSLDIFLPLCSRPGVQISCTMDYQKIGQS
jgi:hypothetical protein